MTINCALSCRISDHNYLYDIMMTWFNSKKTNTKDLSVLIKMSYTTRIIDKTTSMKYNST